MADTTLSLLMTQLSRLEPQICRRYGEETFSDLCFAAVCGRLGDETQVTQTGRLIRAAGNIWKQRYRTESRRRGREAIVGQKPTSEYPSPAELVAGRELSHRVRIELKTLPPNLAQVIRLHYLEQRSLSEICDAIGITRSAAKNRLLRGRVWLRSRLADFGPTEIAV